MHFPLARSAFWWKLGLSAGLVLLGGVFAGLTLGLMGLDLVNLQGKQEGDPTPTFRKKRHSRAARCTHTPLTFIVLSTSGDEQEQKDASKVMRLLERGRHWVLVVLLLSNVVVNESLRELILPFKRTGRDE